MSLDTVKKAWLALRHRGWKVFCRKAAKEFGLIFRNLNRVCMRWRHTLWLPSLPQNEQEPEHILFGLDHPASNCLESNGLLNLVGWCWSKHGIGQVSFFIDNQFHHRIKPVIHRPDAIPAPDAPDSNTPKGFAESINLAGLSYTKHQLIIVITDHAGHRRLIRKTVLHQPPADAYHRFYCAASQQDKTRHPTLPSKGKMLCLFLEEYGDDVSLTGSIISLCDQSYRGWRCMIVPSVARPPVAPALRDIIPPSFQEQFRFAPSIDLVAAGDADFVAFLNAGESLPPTALDQFLGAANHGTDLLYSDHDQVDHAGLHISPHFKPDWSPTYLLSSDYIGGFFLIRHALAADLFPQLTLLDPAWRYDLLLRATHKSKKVPHIPKVLWSSSSDSLRDRATQESEQKIASRFLKKVSPQASIAATNIPHIQQITWPLAPDVKVSLIIPTTGNLRHLKPCVDSLLAKTTTPAFELIFLDNGHGKHPEGIRYLHSTGGLVVSCPEPFNWARLNNLGAQHATGDFFLFLNDDIEIIEEDWLAELTSQASRPEIGAVGGLLLYPDGSIQHAGAFLVDHGGGIRHFLQGLRPGEAIYQHLDRVTREVSACTGACLMIRQGVFAELGGFDENLAVAGNDIDFCLRAADKGYRTLFTPYCRLIHHESLSRRDSTVKSDELKMWARWQDAFHAGDPYYNPNLAQDRTDHTLNLDILRQPISERYRNSPKSGVNLIAYIQAEMGLGEAARGNAQALEMGGVPFAIIDYEHGHSARKDDQTWTHRLSKQPFFDTNILHINADLVIKAKKRLGAEVFNDRYTIGFWVWELPDFPEQWLSAFNEVNEIWVPSTFVQKALAAKSPHPVHCFPHPVAKGQGHYLSRSYFGLPAKRFLFLSMYDFYSIQERKNPCGSIEAFKKAFAGDDNTVALVLKLNNAKEEDLANLRQLIGEHKNIVILDRILSRFEVDSLIRSCDCFVSLHRAEGFGLVLAETMCLGRPVIATGWSGNMEFMTEKNSACVNYELKKLGKDYGPYKSYQHWAEPDIEHASWWMQKFVGNPCEAIALGKMGQPEVSKKLSPLAIGLQIKKRLGEIQSFR